MTLPSLHISTASTLARMSKNAADTSYAQLWAAIRESKPLAVVQEHLRDFEFIERERRKYAGVVERHVTGKYVRAAE